MSDPADSNDEIEEEEDEEDVVDLEDDEEELDEEEEVFESDHENEKSLDFCPDSSPEKNDMPPEFLEALRNPSSADPEVLEEALAWAPTESPSKLLEQAKANKEKKAKGLRLDITAQPVPASYWKDIPRVFPTPFGPLSIAEMRAQTEFAETLEAIMVDHDSIVDRVENPDWLKQNKVWVSQMGKSRQEAPLCVLTRRLFLQNPTAKGCNTFVAGTLNTGDHSNKGAVRLNCKTAGCPGNVSREWDMLALNAWFAHKCKKQLEKSSEVKDFIRFLFGYPCTLEALAFAELAHEHWCARQTNDATNALGKSAQAALAAATGQAGKTPGSSKYSKSKSSSQVQGQQSLGKYLVSTPGGRGGRGKGSKKGEAARKKAKALSFSSQTPEGKNPQPATQPASVQSAKGKKRKPRHSPAARPAKKAAPTSDKGECSRTSGQQAGGDDDGDNSRRIQELKKQLAALRAKK